MVWMDLQQLNVLGEQQSNFRPLVVYQNVIVLLPQLITHECSPLELQPTHTQAFIPSPNKREHKRWQWSSTLPYPLDKIVSNLLCIFLVLSLVVEKGIKETKRRAWFGDSMVLMLQRGQMSLGRGVQSLSQVQAQRLALLCWQTLLTDLYSFQKLLAQLQNPVFFFYFSFFQSSN